MGRVLWNGMVCVGREYVWEKVGENVGEKYGKK